jgi:hypothetical protein
VSPKRIVDAYELDLIGAFFCVRNISGSVQFENWSKMRFVIESYGVCQVRTKESIVLHECSLDVAKALFGLVLERSLH